MLLLYAIWPFLGLVRLGLVVPRSEQLRAVAKGLIPGLAIVIASIVTIDVGYLFEGVGIPLGAFEFSCRSLTRPVAPGESRPRSENPLLDAAWQFRVNRFRGTWLGRIPAPLPEHYLLGFDEQKLESEGIPSRFIDAVRDDRRARTSDNRQPVSGTNSECRNRAMRRRMPIRSISTASCAGRVGGTIICSPWFTRSRKGPGCWSSCRWRSSYW